ncbi:hypothetical protein EV126DRAFT_409896 [Verticillium dahliae]|nr:hypothetical protein EV126DRAFT_409896 [Verticillium dahliae]
MTFPRKAYATLAQLEEQLINETIEPDLCDTTCISEALENYDEENLSLSTIMSEISILQVRMTFLSSSCTNSSEKGSNCMPSPLLLPLEDVEHLQPPIFEQPNPDNFVPLDAVSLIEEDLTTETHAALHVASPPETPVIHLSSTPKEPDILSFTPPSYVKMCDVMFEKPTVAELSSSVHCSVDADQAPTTLDAFAIKSDPIHLLHFSDATILDEPQENNSRTQMYPKGLASQSHHPTGQVKQQLGRNTPTILDSTILLPVPKLDFSIPNPSRASNGCSKMMLSRTSPDPFKEYATYDAGSLRIFQHAENAVINARLPSREGSPAAQSVRQATPLALPGPPAENLLELARKRKADRLRYERVAPQNKRLREYHQPHGEDNKLLLADNVPGALNKMLSNYLALINHPQPRQKSDVLVTPPKTQHVNSQDQLHTGTIPDVTRQWLVPPEEAPYLIITPLEKPVRFFISTMIPRSLIYGFQKYLTAGVDMLDRDFSLPCHGISSLASTSSDNEVSALSFEADMSISASTGIMVTTLLQVRQKPLPGSADTTSQLRKRINNVAPLYERLVVLVWKDGKDDASAGAPLSPAEAAAYSEFVKQNAMLRGTKIEPVYVGGGPRHLVARTIAKVRQYVTCDKQHLLREEETDWEVFLRQAGMNIYAAQLLAASLRDDFGDQGLERFLKMPREERMERFQELLGGSAVLGRMCATLDKRQASKHGDEADWRSQEKTTA